MTDLINKKSSVDITGKRYGRLVVQHKEHVRDIRGKALIKWHCEKQSPNAVNFAHGATFTPDDYIGYAVALAAKAVDRKVETSIDEDDLDI